MQLIPQDFPLVVKYKQPVKKVYVHWVQKGWNPPTATLFLPLVIELPGTWTTSPPTRHIVGMLKELPYNVL
jgi:hypothetical protein